MPENHTDQTEQKKRWSCLSCGCTAVAVPIVVLAIWISSRFFVWSECEIPLPDRSGSVIYEARLKKILLGAEYDRQIRNYANNWPGVELRIPGDTGAGGPVNVYWYPAKGSKGPYLRFNEPSIEYIADLGGGATYIADCQSDGRYLMREILGESLRTSTTERWFEHRVDSDPGVYLGRVVYPYNRFIPKNEAPEAPLPKH